MADSLLHSVSVSCSVASVVVVIFSLIFSWLFGMPHGGYPLILYDDNTTYTGETKCWFRENDKRTPGTGQNIFNGFHPPREWPTPTITIRNQHHRIQHHRKGYHSPVGKKDPRLAQNLRKEVYLECSSGCIQTQTLWFACRIVTSNRYWRHLERPDVVYENC